MRRAAAAGLLLAAAAWSPGVAVEPDLLDAAVTLSEFSRAQGDAALLASAGETMLALAGASPEGRALARGWLDEARFLARGAPGLLARIDAIEAAAPGDPGNGLSVLRVASASAVIELWSGEAGILLRASDPGAPGAPWKPPEQAGRALACAPARTGGAWCAAAEGGGPVTLRSAQGGDAPSYYVFHRGGPRAAGDGEP